MTTEFQYEAFLSYHSADKPRVRRLAERLRTAGRKPKEKCRRQKFFLLEGVAKVFASDCVLTSVAIIDGLLAGIERVRCAKHRESCARIDCKLIFPVTERGRNLAP
jgi:hypothetical protein